MQAILGFFVGLRGGVARLWKPPPTQTIGESGRGKAPSDPAWHLKVRTT